MTARQQETINTQRTLIVSLRTQLQARLVENGVMAARVSQAEMALDAVRRALVFAGEERQPLHVAPHKTQSKALCKTCHHPLAPHVMLAIDPERASADGIATICNVDRCLCFTSTTQLPPEDVMNEMRDVAQHPAEEQEGKG